MSLKINIYNFLYCSTKNEFYSFCLKKTEIKTGLDMLRCCITPWCWWSHPVLSWLVIASWFGTAMNDINPENLNLSSFTIHVNIYIFYLTSVVAPYPLGSHSRHEKEHVYITWHVKSNSLKPFSCLISHASSANQNELPILWLVTDPKGQKSADIQFLVKIIVY